MHVARPPVPRLAAGNPVSAGRQFRLGYARIIDIAGGPMSRPILDPAQIHPAIRDKIENLHADIVHNVRSAAASNPVLVVGMAGNPFCRKARKALAAAEVAHQYLEYGSYFSQWRPRNALKMWTGWPTLPMVFVKGSLIGGAEDLEKLIASGELRRLLAE
jgi:glutaredoxin-related protein